MFWTKLLTTIKESKKYLGKSGTLEKSGSIFLLRIRNLDSILNHIIDLIDSNPIYTEKLDFYNIWKKVCFILLSPFLTPY